MIFLFAQKCKMPLNIDENQAVNACGNVSSLYIVIRLMIRVSH